MNINLPSWLSPRLAILLSVLAAVALSITFNVVDDNGDGKPDRVDITVTTKTKEIPANVQSGDGHPTTTVTVPAKPPADLESDLRSVPESVPDAKVEKLKDAVDENRRTTEALPTGGAVQGFKGCVTRILPVNWSSRNGVRPTVQADHYTVSYNVFGWGDVWSVWGGFANAGRKASSNFIIDTEGHCAYAVPIEGKAWTQAGGNPFAISYEIIAYGNESDYLGPAGWAKLRSVQRQVAARTGIPLRRGAVSGCVPTRSGIVEHRDGGLCWGGHVDITPFSIDRAVKKVVEPTSRLTKYERRIADVRCERRQAVVSAAKGSSTRRQALDESRKARRVVRAQVRKLDQAKRSSGRPWRYRHRGARRHELAGVWVGKGCAGR